MNCLLVIAHHNPQSFNHAILHTISDELASAGHSVQIRDLYQLDFEARFKPTPGSVQEDVGAEQEHILWADVLVYIYPTWWASMPAILKGYIERVFAYGFAYKYVNNQIEGQFADKQVFLFTTHNNTEADYVCSGMLASMSQVVDDGVFRFCGVHHLTHTYLPHIHEVADHERSKMLEDAKQLITSRLSEESKRTEAISTS
ncbi:NAD(P)H-dependent oxidoreductase [Brevibacillus ginsengisoli]|uniref:NAD(P)H-dependent oxidoreductase n=1 Tax=Brevibacillus ginsengisoli TaxID=363854 RepID=UPI003CEF224A